MRELFQIGVRVIFHVFWVNLLTAGIFYHWKRVCRVIRIFEHPTLTIPFSNVAVRMDIPWSAISGIGRIVWVGRSHHICPGISAVEIRLPRSVVATRFYDFEDHVDRVRVFVFHHRWLLFIS